MTKVKLDNELTILSFTGGPRVLLLARQAAVRAHTREGDAGQTRIQDRALRSGTEEKLNAARME